MLSHDRLPSIKLWTVDHADLLDYAYSLPTRSQCGGTRTRVAKIDGKPDDGKNPQLHTSRKRLAASLQRGRAARDTDG